MKRFTFPAAVLVVAMGVFGCSSSHEEGVRSDYRTQWTPVAANTQVTTEAAAAELTAQGLKNVDSSSTGLDGRAEGKMADGTRVKVGVEKKNAGSQVEVTVGALGDPKLGAELAKKIKMRAEGM